MREIHLSSGDSLLIDDPDRIDKSAEVRIVFLREDSIEDGRPQTVDIVE